MQDFGLLIGMHYDVLPTLTDAQPSELMLDSSGRLIISGRYIRDDAAGATDAGINILAVRADTAGSLVSADGDYSPLQVDADGALRVTGELNVVEEDVYEEGEAFTAGDKGTFVLAVREDTLVAMANDDGDYSRFKVNAKGELYIKDADALAELVSANSTLTTIDGTLAGLSHLEDEAHASGDPGIMSLAVRRDANTSLVSTDGDYAPLQVDADGQLKVVIPKGVEVGILPLGSEAFSVTDDLTPNADGLETITAAATPWVTVASLAVGAGETAYLFGYQWVCDQNAQARIVTDDGSDVVVYKQGLNSSAQPEVNAHFTSEGRIEIPGAADLELRLQIKKRSAAGGNASGSGSMHVRVV